MVSHFWSKVKEYLDNRFRTGTKINNNGFYVDVVGMTEYQPELLHIKNECGLGMVITWGSTAASVYNPSNKNIRGECAALSNSRSDPFKLSSGTKTLLNATKLNKFFKIPNIFNTMADTYELDDVKNMVAAENGVTESQLQASLEPINSQVNSLSSILSTLTSTVEMLQKFTENIMPLNWTRLPDMLDYKDPMGIAYGGDKWIAVGTSKAAYSYDGLTWTPLTLSIPSMKGIVYGNGKFIIQSSDTDIFYSENGLNWISVPNIISEGLSLSLSFANGKFIMSLMANGSSSIIYSDDGLVWNRSNINFNYPIYDITYGNGLYVASTNSKNLFYSSDLITWTRVINGTNAESLSSVAFGNGIFVAGGSLIYYSSDGINWTEYEGNEITSSYGAIEFITFANGKFIMGASGGIYYTVHPTNGINFIALEPGRTYQKSKGAYHDGKFIVLGKNERHHIGCF